MKEVFGGMRRVVAVRISSQRGRPFAEVLPGGPSNAEKEDPKLNDREPEAPTDLPLLSFT
jgi:hypothetical protein